jgi:serine/threonine-protein kinase RsbW
VGLTREALAGLADLLALSSERHDDIRTAVTEACNNVVQHAYPDGEVGLLQMDVGVLRDALEVVVSDRGVGMTHAAEQASDLEIGVPVMLALCDHLQVDHPAQGGTEVQLRFGVPGLQADLGGCAAHEGLELPGAAKPLVEVALSSAELAGAILPRLTTALAVRAHFSADGVSDVQMLSDALARHATALAHGGCLKVGLAAGPHRLDLQVGPLEAGGADRLLAHSAPRVPSGMAAGGHAPLSIFERLAQEHSSISIGEQQMLLLRVLDRAR